MTPHSEAPHRRARLAAGAAFFVQGLLFITLTTRLPQLQERWSLDELAVSGLLLMVVLLAGAGSVVAEVVARRFSSAVVVRLGLGVATLGFATLLLAPAFPALRREVSRPTGWGSVSSTHRATCRR